MAWPNCSSVGIPVKVDLMRFLNNGKMFKKLNFRWIKIQRTALKKEEDHILENRSAGAPRLFVT